MEREIRYCTTEDGVRIAYSVQGEGPVLLVCGDLFESFALEHLAPERQNFRSEMARGRTEVRFDYRGVGLSQGDDLADFKMGSIYADLDAVVKAANFDRFTIWSSALGAILAIEYAARNPGRVAALLLWGAFASIAEIYPADVLGGFAQLCRNSWPLAAQMFGDLGSRKEFASEAVGMGELYLESTTGDVAAQMILQNTSIDVTDSLARVSCRTLIMHTMNDDAVPFAQAQKLAAGIPDARLVPFEGVHNEASFGDYGAVIATVNAFLDSDPETRRREQPAKPARAVASTFRTILFTDLVGHTEMMSRLGDERGRAVLREHEAITRGVLKQHAGTEVKTMGDGFMASFASVTRAVECAIALQRAFAARDANLPSPAHGRGTSAGGGLGEGESLNVRVGLNAGEPIEEEGDLFGATVILASRIASRAEGGEILVSDNVRSLCIGKGFLFTDRGEFNAKGFDDPVRVYEVSWRATPSA